MKWVCQRCETFNSEERTQCRICGADKPKAESVIQTAGSVLQAANAVDTAEKQQNAGLEVLNPSPLSTDTAGFPEIVPDEYADLPDPHTTMLSNLKEDRKQSITRILKNVLLIAGVIMLFLFIILLLRSCGASSN